VLKALKRNEVKEKLSELKRKYKRTYRFLWISLAAVAAFQLYFVRELLAAMAIFAIAFVAIGTVALVLYLVDRAGERTVEWVEPQAERAAHAARKAIDRAEEISKKQLHRLRSQTAR
jgi:hypothetical protein